jgi:hypothetical protein
MLHEILGEMDVAAGQQPGRLEQFPASAGYEVVELPITLAVLSHALDDQRLCQSVA